uniref:hypothetical protein n=1 Tax=Thaumasiovibrio occultus TaxID=1891184 RepID=UPI000B3527EC|nr:hypothetical protein [Thaumasiovibrio occultus]
MKLSTIVIALSILLAGCFDSTNNNGVETESFSGLFTYGDALSTFKPCNDVKVYWLDGDEAGMQAVIDEAQTLATERNLPYQSIYIEFQGYHDSGPESHGIASGYDGLIHLSQFGDADIAVPDGCG